MSHRVIDDTRYFHNYLSYKSWFDFFRTWYLGADCGSAYRRHVYLTGRMYPAISIWSISLANVNQAQNQYDIH